MIHSIDNLRRDLHTNQQSISDDGDDGTEIYEKASGGNGLLYTKI